MGANTFPDTIGGRTPFEHLGEKQWSLWPIEGNLWLPHDFSTSFCLSTETLLLLISGLSHIWLLWPHGLQPTRLFCPWDFPGESPRVGCHCLLHNKYYCRPSLAQAQKLWRYKAKKGIVCKWVDSLERKAGKDGRLETEKVGRSYIEELPENYAKYNEFSLLMFSGAVCF